MTASQAAVALLFAGIAAHASAQTCSGVTSVSLTAQWTADSSADVYDLEYAPAIGPQPPAQKYTCEDNICVPTGEGVDGATCAAACGGGAVTPAPAPATPAPPLPPALYVCADQACAAAAAGVALPLCQAACGGAAPGAGNATARGAAAAAVWPSPMEYTSQTSAAASAVVVDLQPATRYIFRVRAHPHGKNVWGWRAFQPAFACTTAASPAGQPHSLRRVGGLAHTSFHVGWELPRGTAPEPLRVAAWDGGAGHRAGWTAAPLEGEPALATVAAAGAATVELTGLSPGRVYWVRVGGSDPVPFRTAAEGVRAWHAMRVSTRVNEIDFLSDKDSGDPPGDAAFLTAASGVGGGTWVLNFNKAVITNYCVEDTGPGKYEWGDYLSCDAGEKGVTSPSCHCAYEEDAKIGHRPCRKGGPTEHCICNKANQTYSETHVGRQAVYEGYLGAGKGQIGWWWSTPAKVECAEGAAPGTAGCVWARHPVSSNVKGQWLLMNGFTKGIGAGVSLKQGIANGKVMAQVHESHPGNPGTVRCCGC